MKILAIDSSGLVASAAIVDGDVLVAEYSVQYQKTHSQTLLPMIEEIRRMTGLSPGSVDAIAVAAGPGSFTGLRIGSSMAKAFGFALDLPLVEIPTLEGMAYNFHGVDRLICPMMDARRGQVYTAVYTFAGGELDTVVPPCAVAVRDMAMELNGLGREVILLGDGAAAHAGVLRSLLDVPFAHAPPHLNRQRAAALAALAQKYMARGRTVAAADHVPDYLRVSQAERVRAEREAAEAARMAREAGDGT